jgi:hypothetical protein
MAIKNINARVALKHDLEANWVLAVNFAPMAGEVIIYDPDENCPYTRCKIGQWTDSTKTATKLLKDLPFEPFTHIGPTPPNNAPVGTIWVDTSDITSAVIYAEEYEAALDEIIQMQESLINGDNNE